MKGVLFFVVLFTCVSFMSAFAQDSIPEFGKISMADMQLQDCPFEKGADAMYLINYESVEIYTTRYGSFVNIERMIRIKIFNPSGTKYASVDIAYFKDAEKIKNLSAVSYNLDRQGNIIATPINNDDIFKQKINEGRKSIRFAFSNVKPGTVIEYKFSEKRNFTSYVEPWLFEKTIPVRVSFYKASYKTSINHMERVVATFPVKKSSDTSLTNDVVETFAMSDIPSHRYEPFTTSFKDNLQYLQFSFLPGFYYNENNSISERWTESIFRLLRSDYFGGQLSNELPHAKKVIDSIKGLPTEEQVNAVYTVVKNDIEWDGSYDFFSEDVDKVWTSKKGSSGDINLTLLNLMIKVGIKCYPTLVSTRGNGMIDMSYCSFSQFNNVDVAVISGNRMLILDATQKYQPYTIFPYNIINTYAMVVEASNKYKWVKISDDNNALMRNTIDIKADIDSAGVMHGTASEYFYDYAKVDILSASNNNEEGSTSRDLLQQDIVDLKIDSLKDQDKDDDTKPLIRRFSFKLEMQQTGDFLFLDPLFLSSFRKNPFKDSVRHFDIDFGCNQSYSVAMYITLPGNIEASELPPNKEVRLADTSFSYGRFTALQNNAIIMRTHFDLQNASYAADQYPLVKEVFGKMYAMFNEQIVLKRKN